MCQSARWRCGGEVGIGGHCSSFQTTWPDLADNRGIRDLIQPWWKVLNWNGKLNMLHYIIVVLENEWGCLRLESRRGRECHCRWRSNISGSHIKWLWRKNKCRRGLMERGVLRDEDDDRWGHTDWRRRDETTGGGTRRPEAGRDDRRRDQTTGDGTRRDDRRRIEAGRDDRKRDQMIGGGKTRRGEATRGDRRRDGTTGSVPRRPEARRDDRRREETTGGGKRWREAGRHDRKRDDTTGGGTRRPEARRDDRRRDDTTGGGTRRPEAGRDDRRRDDTTGGGTRRREAGQHDRRRDDTTGGGTRRPEARRDDKRWEDDAWWQEEAGQGDLRCDVTTRQAEHGDWRLEAGGWRWLPKAGGDGPKWDVMAGRGFDDAWIWWQETGCNGWRRWWLEAMYKLQRYVYFVVFVIFINYHFAVDVWGLFSISQNNYLLSFSSK